MESLTVVSMYILEFLSLKALKFTFPFQLKPENERVSDIGSVMH